MKLKVIESTLYFIKSVYYAWIAITTTYQLVYSEYDKFVEIINGPLIRAIIAVSILEMIHNLIGYFKIHFGRNSR